MPDLHDVVRAVSLTRVHEWGTEVQVLLALAAEPAPFGEIPVSLRDLSHETALSLGQLARVLKRLEERRVIAKDAGRGQEPSSFWIRPINEWGMVPWRVELREVGIRIDASFGLHARTADLDSARSQKRARRRSVNGRSRSATWVARASRSARSEGLARAPRSARYGGEREPSDNSLVIDNQIYPSEQQLSEKEQLLVKAFEKGVGLVIYGALLARVRRIANECNGELERLCQIAEDLNGPHDWNERCALLEREMVGAPPPDPRGMFLPGTGWISPVN